MKVAVISAEPTCGKSALIEVLGAVYSRSQQRDVVVFSTGDITDNIETITNYEEKNVADSPHIVKSMIEGAEMNDKDLLNYGVRAGQEHVYYFDTNNNSMSPEDKMEFIIGAIEKVPSGLTLVEICGDVESELNRAVMAKCDCSIMLVDPSLKGFRKFKEEANKLPKGAMQMNMAITLSRLDSRTMGDKLLAAKMGINAKQIHRFPYNINIPKLSVNKQLDEIAYKIIIGDSEVVGLRTPMLELMQFIFDSPTRKIIREVSRWYK